MLKKSNQIYIHYFIHFESKKLCVLCMCGTFDVVQVLQDRLLFKFFLKESVGKSFGQSADIQPSP